MDSIQDPICTKVNEKSENVRAKYCVSRGFKVELEVVSDSSRVVWTPTEIILTRLLVNN